MLVAVIAAAVPLICLLRVPVQGNDEGLLLVHPEEVLRGSEPHRDFATVYGPLTYWTLALVFRLSGPSLYAERLVGVTYRMVLALALALLLKRSVGAGAAAAAAVVSLVMQITLVPLAYGFFGALACTVSGLAVLANQSGPRARAAGGALLGLAAGFRPEMGVLALGGVPLLLNGSKRPVILGWFIGLLPLAFHLTRAAPEVYRDVIEGRMMVNAQVADISPVLATGVAVLAAISVATLVVAHREKDHALGAAGLVCVLLLPQATQRLDLSHVLWVASVIVPVGLACGLRGFTRLRSGPGTWAAPLLATSVAAVALVVVMPLSSPTVSREGRSLHVAAAQVDTVNEVLDSVDEVAPPGAAVFVGAQDMSRAVLTSSWLYHLMPDRPLPFRYTEFLPGATERRGSGLVEDIDAADVLILEDLSELSKVLTPNTPPGDQEANEVVARDFCVARTIGEFQVLVRRSRC
jgi:hypothetical protein